MKLLNIFLGEHVPNEIVGDIIAVDCFGINLINAGHVNFISIGDFDSCVNDEFKQLEKHSLVKKFPAVKNEGDLELAILYGIENNYTHVLVHNIFCGNRVDHFINNILIFKKYKDRIDLRVKDEFNYMYFLKNNNMVYKSNYKYISLIILENVKNLLISDDFKYQVNGYVYQFDTRFISNELINNQGS
ncbi:MAG: thiamine diphosphokinase, partial [Bacilli bacterium]